MIYFDKKTKDVLVEKIALNMQAGGYLFIGHAESLGQANRFFDYVMPAVYRRKMF